MMKLLRIRVFLPVVVLLFLISGVWSWWQYQDVKGPGIPVLLYHGVDNERPKNKYTLDTDAFERQLQCLKYNGYQTILPSDIHGRVCEKNPEKTVILSFDDGLLNNYEIVFPLLRKYGFKGLFFFITAEIGKNGRITAEQLKEMSDSGMELGSHTISHPYLDTLNSAEVVHQLQHSKQTLENISGKKVTSLAPPGGWFDTETEKIALQQGYDFFFSCEIGLNDLTENPFVYKRIEVLRSMSLKEFQDLLVPTRAFEYKLEQSLKFALHSLIGTSNYVKLSHVF